ncbi:hypothetical protein VNO77_21936 [Canavalia gladiata]|uniref:Protein E6 n=1 Tax=Canavalia gladiata TaxID=3824 RepID=A0AAN9QE15_CANGL
MATLSNYISFLFLTTLLLSLQIRARDSQFFSKVTNFNDNNNYNNVKETEVPNKEGQEINKGEQQQPVFIPETENSYGLYGQESNGSPSKTTTTPTNAAPYTTTTTSYHPYRTEFEDTSKYPNNNNNNNYYYNNDAYNKDTYEGNQYELSDAKYTDERYNSLGNYQNNNHNNYNNNNNNYNDNNNRYSHNTNAANNRYNGERQGMSDTRFLEGGRYYHDVSMEEKYNPTTLYGDSSRGVNTNNWYTNRGNNNGNYNGYQNHEEFEDEQQEEFQP